MHNISTQKELQLIAKPIILSQSYVLNANLVFKCFLHMIPVPPKARPVFILFLSLMVEIPLPIKSILVLNNKFN